MEKACTNIEANYALKHLTCYANPDFSTNPGSAKKPLDTFIPLSFTFCVSVAISLIGEHIRGMLRGKGLTRRRTSTFVDPESNPQPLVQQPQASLRRLELQILFRVSPAIVRLIGSIYTVLYSEKFSSWSEAGSYRKVTPSAHRCSRLKLSQEMTLSA